MNSPEKTLPKWFVPLLALSVGTIAANLYYAQPLISLIAKSLELNPSIAGLVTTLTQIGYGLGVLLIVPLGDLLENKKLILVMMILAVIGLMGVTFSSTLIPYFIAAFIVGVGASAVQLIIPYVAHLTPELTRGRTVGTLMSGLMIGIMLSRTIASFLADLFTWHAVFLVSAVIMVLLGSVLYKFLPKRKPNTLNLTYSSLIASMGRLFLDNEILRRRGIYQAFCFGAFCLFWTATPLLLASPAFNFSQSGIALFALAGIAGAVSAPVAGKYADKGFIKQATAVALLSSSLSFVMTHIFMPGSFLSLASLVIAGICLDAGVTANLVLGQRAIFSLTPEHRNRLNGLYIAMIFVGGACGSTLGAWAYDKGGWELASIVGLTMPLAAFVFFLTEGKRNLY